jgi:hypothetical protein
MISHVTSSANVLSKLRANFAHLHAAIDVDDVEKCRVRAAQGITRCVEIPATTLGRQVMEAANRQEWIAIRDSTSING